MKDIWAKADSEAHARILSQIGTHHVIRPERDTGRRVAYLLGGRFRDFAEIATDYGVTQMAVPSSLVGRPLDLSAIWRTHRVQWSLCAARKWAPLADATELTPPISSSPPAAPGPRKIFPVLARVDLVLGLA